MKNMSCTSQNMIKRTVDGVNSFAGPFKYGLIYKNKFPGVEYYPVPCGRCNYCKLKKAKTWAARCTLEAANWPYNYFITLTYDDEYLPLIDNYDPKLGSLEKRSNLVVRDLQLFFKRFRKLGYKLKYLASGEYGTQTERAHYHLIVFTDKPLEIKYYKLNENKDILYTSKTISKLWPYGFNVVATFTPATAAYVARYTLKKQLKNNYSFLKQNYKQEFLLCSRGIGFPNIVKNLKNIADNKYISYSFQNSVQYMQVWNYAVKKLEELGYEKEAQELTTFYRAKAARVNKVNNIGYQNWVNKNDNLKYLFWLKSKKLNTKL